MIFLIAGPRKDSVADIDHLTTMADNYSQILMVLQPKLQTGGVHLIKVVGPNVILTPI